MASLVGWALVFGVAAVIGLWLFAARRSERRRRVERMRRFASYSLKLDTTGDVASAVEQLLGRFTGPEDSAPEGEGINEAILGLAANLTPASAVDHSAAKGFAERLGLRETTASFDAAALPFPLPPGFTPLRYWSAAEASPGKPCVLHAEGVGDMEQVADSYVQRLRERGDTAAQRLRMGNFASVESERFPMRVDMLLVDGDNGGEDRIALRFVNGTHDPAGAA